MDAEPNFVAVRVFAEAVDVATTAEAPAIGSVVGAGVVPVGLTWDAFSALVTLLAEEVARDGLPEVIVGILRGGMVPAVMLAHRWGLRVVRGLDVVHTLADGVDAAKAPNPVVRDQDSLGDLGGMNVLVVDDVAGSGQTVATAREMVAARGADRVRTLACVVNEANWPPDAEDPAKVLTYLGRRQRGWVIFPWESP